MKLARHFPSRPASDTPAAGAAELYGSPPVSYRPEEHGPARRFEQTPTGRAVQRQYRQGAEHLKGFLGAHPRAGCGPAIAAIDRFANNVEHGSDGYFGPEIELVYGGGKERFDALCAGVRDDRIPLDTRVNTVIDLSHGLLCASGSISNVMIAAERLTLMASGGVASTASQAWSDLLDASVGEFSDRHHGGHPGYAGNQIHYCNGYRNFLSDRFGVEQRPDELVPQFRIDEQSLDSCLRFVETRVTAARLVGNMADACLQEVHAHCTGAWPDRSLDRPLDEGAAFELREDLEANLCPVLQMRYGDIPVGILVVEHSDAEDAEHCYELNQNPTLLSHAIAKNLRAAGVMDSFKTTLVAGNKGDREWVKQVGDAFYVKSLSGARRPLTVDDLGLCRSPASPALLFAAMANTREDRRLARLSPNEAWDASAGGPLGSELPTLERLASIPLRRYQSAIGHTDFFIAATVEAVSRLSAPLRHAALMQALTHGNDALAQRLLPGVDDCNLLDQLGRTACHYAAWKCPPTLEALLGRSPGSLDARDKRGATPLMFAADQGLEPAAALLCARGADVNAKDAWGTTPLIIASGRGFASVAKLLLGAGARISADCEGQTAMSMAARAGHIEIIHLLCDARAPLDVGIGPQGYTPLMHAVIGNQPDAVETLLNRGALIDVFSKEHTNALMLASQGGKVRLIELLLNRGAGVDDINASGVTALMVAAEKGHRDAVDLLLKRGANPALENVWGSTALGLAIQHQRTLAVQILIDAPGRNGITPLMRAVAEKNLEAVAIVLRHGADLEAVDDEGATALLIAASSGNPKIVELLLEGGAVLGAVDARDATAPMRAAEEGHLAAMALLLGKGASPTAVDASGDTLLMYAIRGGNLEVVQAVLALNRLEDAALSSDGRAASTAAANTQQRQGADLEAVNDEGATALLIAADSGELEIIELLIQGGAMLGAVDKNGAGTLMHAAQERNLEAMRLLLRIGASPTAVDRSGKNLLTYAILSGDPDVADAVLALKCLDVNAVDEDGASALMTAAEVGNVPIMRTLCEAGANVGAVDGTGESLLMFAVRSGQAPAVEAVLAMGVDVNHRNASGTTALSYAVDIANHTVIDVLCTAGADVNAADEDGITPLIIAAEEGNVPLIRKLHALGARIDLKDMDGPTAIRGAMEGGHPEAVKTLLELLKPA